MPLTKQPLFIPLGVGLHRESADLVLPIGQGTLGLSNAFIDRSGQIVKRKGATTLSNARVSFGTVSAPWQLTTYKDALTRLGYTGGDPIAVYSPETDKWATAIISTLRSGLDGPLATKVTPLNRTAGALNTVWSDDVAVGGGYVLTAYTVGGNELHFDVFDQITGQRVSTYTIVGATRARCTFVAGHLVGLYVASNLLKLADFNLAALGGGPAISTVAGTVDDAINLEVMSTPAGGFSVLFQLTGSGLLVEAIYDATVTILGTFNVLNASGVFVTSDRMFTYVKQYGGATVRSIVNFTGLNGAEAHINLVPSGGAMQATTTTTLSSVAAAKNDNNGATAWDLTVGGISPNVAWEEIHPPSSIPKIWTAVAGGTLAYTWAKLASKVWQKNTHLFMLIEQNGSFYVVRPLQESGEYPAPIATVLRGAAGLPTKGRQSNVATVNDNPFGLVVPSAPEIDAMAGSVGTVPGADFIRLDYEHPGSTDPITGAPSDPFTSRPAEAISSLFVATGGQLCQFDGRNYGEVSFPGFPEIVSATATTGSGAMTPDADYTYQIVWVRRDNNGLWWRSAPSETATVHTAAAGPPIGVALVYKNPTLSGWDADTTFVEVYRGQANSSAPLNLVSRRLVANFTDETATFNDLYSDAQVAEGRPLYTTGGILESAPLPGTRIVLNALNRLWIVDSDDPTRLWPSNNFIDGEGARFSEDTIITLRDVSATPITALAAVDDKVIVFKSDRIYAITGDGPNQAGQGGFNINTIAIGIGTDNPQSVVSFVHGMIFQGAHGYQFMDRGLSISSPFPGTTFVGQPIHDAYGQLIIRAAVHLPKQGQIRLYSLAGNTLVLDYLHWAWSIYEVQTATTATVWNDLGAYFNGTGGGPAVMAESDSLYVEGSTLYHLQVTTPWISFAGVGALERIYRFQGVGLTVDDHTVTVTLNINGDGDTTITTKSRPMLATEIVWPWELRPRVQKFSSALLTISETAAVPTAGPAITGISLIVGAKVGLRKLYAPSARLT
jgi:hypothetical protein